MSKLTRKALLKHLNKSDKEDIIIEVVTLFDKFKNVKEFYRAELSDEANPELESYKRKITEAYSRANPKERTTNANINKLLKEFKKISIYDRELVDLLLHRVECGVDAFNKNSKRTSTFYNCIHTTFNDAIELIAAEGEMREYKPRIDNIIKKAGTGKYEIKERMEKIRNSFSL